MSKYIPAENKIKKNKKSKDFLLNTKQVFSGRNLENFSGEYGSEIFGFQFKPVSTKPTQTSYKSHKLRHFF